MRVSLPTDTDDRVWRLLLAACHHDAERQLDDATVSALGDENLRATFLDRGWRHGVLGLALGSLERSASFRRLPTPVTDECANHAQRLWRHAALWVLERNRVLSALVERQLRPVVLKGAALSTTLYRSPAERRVRDIDLLFAPEDVDRAVDTLVILGYQEPPPEIRRSYAERHFHFRVVHPRGFIVELHWGLVTPSSPQRLDPASFIADAVWLQDRDAMRLRVPRPEHRLLHAVAQNNEHRFDRLVGIIDIDRIVRSLPDLDWARTIQEAERGGWTPSLALSLQLARRLLGTPVPQDLPAKLHLSRPVRFHLQLLRPGTSLLEQRFVVRWAPAFLLGLWLQPDRWMRVRYLVGIPADPMAQVPTEEGSRGGLRTKLAALGTRLSTVLKLALYQPALYLRAIATTVARRAGRDAHFWRVGEPAERVP